MSARTIVPGGVTSRRLVDLDPVAAELLSEHRTVAEPGAGPKPRRRRCGADDEGALDPAVVVRPVLDADDRGFGPADAPPEPCPSQRASLEAHLPEEVVRREEGEIAAEVAEVLDQVELMPRHVLGVAREDDEVVEGSQLLAGANRLEVGLGEELRLLARRVEPAEEADVVLPPLRRHAAAKEHPAELRGALRALRVPGVAPAVPVGVAEVVGLPRVRRDHDRDAARRPERRRPDGERRVADPAVVRRQLHEVDAGRPRADREVERRAAVSGRPGNRHRLVHRHAVHERVAVRRAFLRPGAEGLQGQRLCIGLDRQAGRAAARRSSRP